MGMANRCPAYQSNGSTTISSLTLLSCCNHPVSISHTSIPRQLKGQYHNLSFKPIYKGNFSSYIREDKEILYLLVDELRKQLPNSDIILSNKQT